MGSIKLIVPRGWTVRIDGARTNTSRISNNAAIPRRRLTCRRGRF